jgi:hypothetical protein
MSPYLLSQSVQMSHITSSLHRYQVAQTQGFLQKD